MADPTKESAMSLKKQGNLAMEQGKPEEALSFYTEALKVEPQNFLVLGNRCVALCHLQKFKEALEDAENAIKIKPTWAKGYLRKGVALSLLKRHEEALVTFLDGLNFDPNNAQLKQCAKEEKAKITGAPVDNPLVAPFADLHLWDKLRQNSETRKYMQDSEYVRRIKEIQEDPKKLKDYMDDARVMATLAMLLGVDMEMPNMAGKDQSPADMKSNMDNMCTMSPTIENLGQVEQQGLTITEISNEEEIEGMTVIKDDEAKCQSKEDTTSEMELEEEPEEIDPVDWNKSVPNDKRETANNENMAGSSVQVLK